MERLTEQYKGNNSIPLLNSVCGVDLPRWSIRYESNIRQYLIGDAADRLSAFEDTSLEPSEILALKAENERLKAERRWIPIAERMPCISDGKAISNTIHVVLCFFADGYMVVFDIDDIDRWNDFDSKYKITHWMPLPEPPKEEGGEKSRER